MTGAPRLRLMHGTCRPHQPPVDRMVALRMPASTAERFLMLLARDADAARAEGRDSEAERLDWLLGDWREAMRGEGGR